MNYMKQVAEMLGVELGERFIIEEVGEDDVECYLGDRGLVVTSEIASAIMRNSLLMNLLMGDSKIIKKPWKPKEGDTFWCVCHLTGDDYYCKSDIFNGKSVVDVAFLAFGNYFKTQEDAEAHKDEILAKKQEVLNG